MWWQRATTSGRVSLVFVAYLVFSILFFMLGPFGDVEAAGGIVDDDFGAGAADVLDAVAALGDDGRSAYQTFLLGDMAFTLLQGAWMAGFILLGMRQWRSLPGWTPLVPVAATAFDVVENLAFLAILQSPSTAAAWLAVVAMHLKLVAVIASILAVLAVLGWWLSHPVRRQPRRPTRSSAPGAPGSGDPGRDPRGRRRTREH